MKLVINIKNNEPLNLLDLTVGLNSFAKLYSDFNKDNIQAKSIENNHIFVGCNFNGKEAIQMKDNINEIIKDENKYTYEKQLFKWVQTNFNNLKTGNKGNIEKITKESLRVIFNNETIKKQMTSSSDNIEWQNKYYIVDVEALYVDEKPKVYKILNNYAEYSFSMLD